jgi:periplasmic divalent cation tolerance protein
VESVLSQIQFTIDDAAAARTIVEKLLLERLIGCAHEFQPVTSRYRWKGKLETAAEWLITMKTTTTLEQRVMDRVKELHPYDTPEILVFPIVGGSPAYIEWVMSETTADSGN